MRSPILHPRVASLARVARLFAVALVSVWFALSAAAPAASAFTGADVDRFAASYNGRSVDYDGLYGAQCVDLFNFYNRDLVGGGFVTGVVGAKDLWTTGSTAAHYNKVAASARAVKGDVAIYDGSLGGGFGHVAIVLDDLGGSLRVVQQNWSPYRTTIDVISKAHLLGYLRPKNLSVRAQPQGSLDLVGSPTPGTVRVGGWAFDGDNPGAPLAVHVYVGGPAGTAGAEGHAIGATGARPDVGAVYPAAGPNHGFDSTLVTGKRGAQQVCVYAINDDDSGNPLLGCRTTTIADPDVRGAFDEASSPEGGKVRVRGWTYDPNAPTKTGVVHLYIGGPAGSPQAEGHPLNADASRPDVDRVFGVGANHGVDTSVTTAKRGEQQVCLYAIDIAAPGNNLALGCKRVVIGEPPVAPQPGSTQSPTAGQAPLAVSVLQAKIRRSSQVGLRISGAGAGGTVEISWFRQGRTAKASRRVLPGTGVVRVKAPEQSGTYLLRVRASDGRVAERSVAVLRRR